MEELLKNRLFLNLFNLKNLDLEIIFDLLYNSMKIEFENNNELYYFIRNLLKKIIDLNENYILNFNNLIKKFQVKKDNLMENNLLTFRDSLTYYILNRIEENEKIKENFQNLIKIDNIKNKKSNQIFENFKKIKNDIYNENNKIISDVNDYKNVFKAKKKINKNEGKNETIYSDYSQSFRSFSIENELLEKNKKENYIKNKWNDNENELKISFVNKIKNIFNLENEYKQNIHNYYNTIFDNLENFMSIINYNEKFINLNLNEISSIYDNNLRSILNNYINKPNLLNNFKKLFNFLNNNYSKKIENNYNSKLILNKDIKYTIIIFNAIWSDFKLSFNEENIKLFTNVINNNKILKLTVFENLKILANLQIPPIFKNNKKIWSYLFNNILKTDLLKLDFINCNNILNILNNIKYKKRNMGKRFLKKLYKNELLNNYKFWIKYINELNNINQNESNLYQSFFSKNKEINNDEKIKLIQSIFLLMIKNKFQIYNIFKILKKVFEEFNLKNLKSFYNKNKNIIIDSIYKSKKKFILIKNNINKINFVINKSLDYLDIKNIINLLTLRKKFINKNKLFYQILLKNKNNKELIYNKLLNINKVEVFVNGSKFNEINNVINDLKEYEKEFKNEIDINILCSIIINLLTKLNIPYSIYKHFKYIMPNIYNYFDKNDKLTYNFCYHLFKNKIFKIFNKNIKYYDFLYYSLNYFFKMKLRKIYYEFEKNDIPIKLILKSFILNFFTNCLINKELFENIWNIFLIESYHGIISLILFFWDNIKDDISIKNINSFENLLKEKIVNYKGNLLKDINPYLIEKYIFEDLYSDYLKKILEENFFWNLLN